MVKSDNDKVRCPWAQDEEMIRYHDEEWGVLIKEDQKHFEFLTLESAQAGLSWSTILKRRDNYKKAFANFDPEKVMAYDRTKIQELLLDTGIIRNRAKIEAAVNNAACFLKISERFGSFYDYLISFSGGRIINRWEDLSQIPAKTELSEEISRDLKKKRGFKFIGPVVLYSHLQASGIVNDHLISCFRYKEVMD